MILFNIEDIRRLSAESFDVALWKLTLICVFCIMANTVLTLAIWFLRKSAIIEYGYPKAKGKTLRKHIKSFTLLQKVFLFRLVDEARRPGLYLYFCVLLNLLNCISAVGWTFGIIALLITKCGWAFLLEFLPLEVLAVNVIVGFIPDLICLPSERNRYRIGKRKK